MYEIKELDDLIKLGRQSSDTISLPEGIYVFTKSIEIPFALKLDGVTSLQGSPGISIRFKGKNTAIKCTGNCESITFRKIGLVTTDIQLLNIRKNNLRQISFSDCYLDVYDFGEVSVRNLTMIRTSIDNAHMKPLKLDSINSVNLIAIDASKSYIPILSLNHDAVVRDTVIVHDCKIKKESNLISIGITEANDAMLLAHIPERSIYLRGTSMVSHTLFATYHETIQKYHGVEARVVKSYFG